MLCRLRILHCNSSLLRGSRGILSATFPAHFTHRLPVSATLLVQRPVSIISADRRMSVSTSITAGEAGSVWSCRSCGHSNTFSVRLLSTVASVPCPKCGCFQSLNRPANGINRSHPTAGSGLNPSSPVRTASTSASASTSHTGGDSDAAQPAFASIPSVITQAPLRLDDESVVERFKQFIRIPTVANEGTTNGANEAAVAFLKAVGENMGLKSSIVEFAPHRPILVLTLQGRDPTLPSVLLNSHYDVVPTMKEHWKTDPFAATEDAEGTIFGRGTQDMKPVCMGYLEAMLRLIRNEHKQQGSFLRTIHLSFQPDEETGGEWGMQKWVDSPEFKALNVGFALDEGIANPKNEYTVFYGERGVWWMTVKATGPTGHASRFIANPATQKLHRSIQHFLSYRAQQEKKLLTSSHDVHSHSECGHAMSKKLELGDVITMNLTVLKAGVSVDGGKTHSFNVVPMEAEAGFDLRIPPSIDLVEFENKIKEWTSEEGVSYTVRKFSAEYVTQLDEERNPFWATFKKTLESSPTETKVAPQIFPAGTDSRFLRKAGIPVIGFSPLRNTAVLLHDHNESIHRSIYLEGVEVYTRLIPELANVETNMKNADGVYLAQKIPMDPEESVILFQGGANTMKAGAPAAAAGDDSSSSSQQPTSDQREAKIEPPVLPETEVAAAEQK